MRRASYIGSGVKLPALNYKNPGSNPVLRCCAFLLQFFSLYIDPVHSAVYLNTWLQTVVDICTSSPRALIVAYGWMLPREAEMVSV